MFKNTLKITCGSSLPLKDNIVLTRTHTQTYLYLWIYIRNSGTVLYLMTVKLKCICNVGKEKQSPGLTVCCVAYFDFCLKHLSTCFVSLHSSFISTPLLIFLPITLNAKMYTSCCRAASSALCHLRGTRT